MPNPESDSRPEYEIRQFNFKNVPETSEFKNFRLKAFKTPDGWEDISTWKDIYRSFCQYVFNCKPNQIKALKDLDDTFLSRNVFFSSAPDNLNRAFKLNTKFYVEQNLSSSGIVDIIKKLIYYCRLPASQFIVRYEAPVTEDASESEPSSEPEPSAGLQSVPVLPKFPCFTIDNPPSLKNTGSKPVSIKFGLRLNNWNDVLEEVVRFIDFYYPECIDEIYDDYGPKGKVRKLILAKSKRSFTNSSSTKAPRFIRQNLYVKADLATDDVIQLAAAFLSYCDISLSDVLVEYRPKNLVVPELPLAPSSDAQHDDAEPEPDDELDESDGDDYYEFDNDLASGLSDKDIKDIYDDEEEDEDFDDDGGVIGFQFYDNGKPVITPWLQKFIDAIEENYPEGIDFDNIDNIATIELASGERCDEDAIALLKMALFKNEEGFYYVPLRIADESTVKAMADFIDNGIRQYNAVSLSVINEKFQDQLDYECDNEELAEFVEWYVFKEIDRLIAIEFNDSDDDGVCLLDSETTDEFCENFYGQIESYLEKTDSPVPMSQLRQLYPTLNETIISYALGDDRFGYSIQEEEKDGQLFYSVRSDSQLNDKAADLVESEQTPQTAPPPENSYFNLDDSIPDLTNAKALSISFGEKEFEILSWSGIVLQTAIYIDQNEPDAFNSLIEQYGQPNSKPHLFSHDKFEKLSCKPVNSDYYVNTNFCATTAVKTAQLFLDSCKLPLSEVRIEYLPAGMQIETRRVQNPAPSRQQILLELPETPPELTPELQTLLQVIEETFPQGVDLETSISILENKSGVQCSRKIIGDLKYFLFESVNGLFYLPSQIADESTLNDLAAFIDQQIKRYGALATSVIRDKFRYRLKFIVSEDNDDLLEFVNNRVNPRLEQKIQTFYDEDSNYSICLPESTTEEQFDKSVSLQIKQYLQERNCAVPMYELCGQFPYLDKDILEYYLDDDDYVDDVFPVYNEDEDVNYYRTIDSLYLEDDFSEALTHAVDEFESRGETATITSIGAKLDEHYGFESEDGQSEFRKQYELTDDDAFRYVVLHRYAGEIKHHWKPKTRFVPQTSTGTIKLYEGFQNLYPNCGVFHENRFFEYAIKKTGNYNTAALALAYLRPHCVRLDIDHWIDIQEFKEQSNFSPELAGAITERLTQQLGSRPFLPIGLLSDSFFDELPELRVNGKLWQWNEYLLTSVSVLLIDDLNVVNDEPNSNQVTAMLIPRSVSIPNDIIEYAVECYLQQNGSNASIDGAIDFLKQNRIRLKKTAKLEQQLEGLLKEW